MDPSFTNSQTDQIPYSYPYSCMHGPFACPSDPSAMREIIYQMAAMQPVEWIDPESIKPPKRRNVKISADPQSVAARLRRERISEKMRTLQRLVPGGTKMDTASMLDEAVNYMRFLKRQVQLLEMEMQSSPSGNFRGGYFSGLGDSQGSVGSGSESI